VISAGVFREEHRINLLGVERADGFKWGKMN
jgi:hypothetical protein